jgi:hypothetical protein
MTVDLRIVQLTTLCVKDKCLYDYCIKDFVNKIYVYTVIINLCPFFFPVLMNTVSEQAVSSVITK